MIDTDLKLGDRAPLKKKIPNLVISLVLLALFTMGFFIALTWPPEAGRFPLIITIVGGLCSALLLVKTIQETRKSPRKSASTTPGKEDTETAEISEVEEKMEDFDAGYIFTVAGKKAWANALIWIGAFFLLTYIAGIYLAGAIFAVSYLRFGAKKSWVFSIVYATVLIGILWGLFNYFLALPLPKGILGLA